MYVHRRYLYKLIVKKGYLFLFQKNMILPKLVITQISNFLTITEVIFSWAHNNLSSFHSTNKIFKPFGSTKRLFCFDKHKLRLMLMNH